MSPFALPSFARPLLLMVGLAAAAAPSGAQIRARVAPDLVLTNGKIFTADPSRPWAEALAIRGDRIVAVGRTAEIARLAGPATRRIALGGRVVVPGFNDAHAHLGAVPLGTVVVTSAAPQPDPSLRLVLDSVRAAARRAPRGRWLVTSIGMRVLDDTLLRSAAMRDSLDRVAPNHPVLLEGDWGHGTVVNSAALRRLGIGEGSPPPFAGWYERDAEGRLTGRLQEYAAWRAIRAARSALPSRAIAGEFRKLATELPAFGITSIQDMSTALDPRATVVALRAAPLPVRMRLVATPMPDGTGAGVDEWESVALRPSPLVERSGTKWILDGTPIERLALMRAPYADAAPSRGRLAVLPEVIRTLLARAASGEATRERQLLLHVAGDSTTRLVFAYMRAIAPDSVWRARRVRIEHGDWVSGELLPIARRLGVVVVQNPLHFALPPGMVEARFGRRPPALQAVRAIGAAGIPLAFGSDGPRNPYLGILLATTHPSNPSQRLTREQAVTAYTRGSAYAEFAEREKGTLAAGMLADLAVLSQDIFTVPPPRLPATSSVLTLLGGRVVHDAKVLTRAR